MRTFRMVELGNLPLLEVLLAALATVQLAVLRHAGHLACCPLAAFSSTEEGLIK